MLVTGLPSSFAPLSAALSWAGHRPALESFSIKFSPSLLFLKPWVRQTPTGDRILYLGTNRYTGMRTLLVDSLAIRTIHTAILSLTSLQLPPLDLTPAGDYVNIVEVHVPSPKKLRARMALLRLSNRSRAKKFAARRDELRNARDWARGGDDGRAAVVTVAVVAPESGRRKRKKVMEIGWAKWEIGREGDGSDVYDLGDRLSRGLSLGGSPEPNSGDVSDDAPLDVQHIVVEENMHRHNGRFVPDRTAAFVFGQSTVLPHAAARASFLAVLASLRGRVAIVGNVQFALAVLDIRDEVARSGIPTFDVGKLSRTARYDNEVPTTLEDLLAFYAVPHDPDLIHNAGNDALYTFETFLALSAAEESKSVPTL